MNDFLSKCHKIPRKLQILSHLLKKSLMENFIFRAVLIWNNHHKFLVHELNFKTKYNTDIKFKRL